MDPKHITDTRSLLDALDHRGDDPESRTAFDEAVWASRGREGAILVTDLSGFTKQTKRHGILHFLQVFRRCEVTCMPILARFGGVLMKQEADDLIGTLANRARERSVPVTIVSADKDLSQLIGPEDEQWDFARNRRWDQAGVEERFGVRPDQIADLLALSGDSVDNIPGVRGVGPTTAAALLRHFDNLDALYRRLEELPFLRLRGAKAAYGKLKPAREEALLYRRLTQIALDAPIDLSWEQLSPARVDLDAADQLFDQVGFGPLFKSRARRLAAR